MLSSSRWQHSAWLPRMLLWLSHILRAKEDGEWRRAEMLGSYLLGSNLGSSAYEPCSLVYEWLASLCLLKKYFNWKIITLQYCDGFCHTSLWIGHRYNVSPPAWIPRPIPPGFQSVLTLGALCHMSNSYWLSLLHIVMCTFQCYSLKPSHPPLLPLSLKIRSLCLCLLCCPAHRIVGTIFLDPIYVC